ncbi:MAG TPA: hypothetical protein VHN15_01975 [Thermoanaerobaculia bacterium]|nr:hypothetical protein [Thermoanaerobaculia bacterium]
MRETAGIPRSGEILSSGCPLPRGMEKDPTRFAVIGPDGKPVPGEFEPIAKWPDGSIRWLRVAFPASAGAREDTTYRLRVGVTGPAPQQRIRVERTDDGKTVRVDTGAATFSVGALALLEQAQLPGGPPLLQGGTLEADIQGQHGAACSLRRLEVQWEGPLTAVVFVEAPYSLTFGEGAVVSRRRYTFTAGSPVALVEQATVWEGTLLGPVWRRGDGPINAVLVDRVRDSLALGIRAGNGGEGVDVTVVGAFQEPERRIRLTTGEAALRQRLRPERLAPLRFEITADGQEPAGGVRADGGLLSVAGPHGAVAVGIRQMHRYEPQALRVLGGGETLAVDVCDDTAWLALRQGMFATVALGVFPTAPDRAALDQLWARLNRPLRALPSASWINGTKAWDEIPDTATLPAQLALYDTLVPKVLRRTLDKIDSEGIPGLMTFGVFPRYWGESWGSPELEGKDDPTPGQGWDNAYLFGTWTDYHNTCATAATWALRSGEAEWLDEITVPAALRTLHTQIYQGSPTDTYPYIGQAPSGYSGYRSDFNSSHQYFDNLYLFYYLTGHRFVPELLKRGADSDQRRWKIGQQGYSGRSSHQRIFQVRFVGTAISPEHHQLAIDLTRKAISLCYAELEHQGKTYGFWGETPVPAAGPAAFPVHNLWSWAFYDMNSVFWLMRETDDEEWEGIRPSRVLVNVARMLSEVAPRLEGDGTVAGRWTRKIEVTFEGPKVGGKVSKLAPLVEGEKYLFSGDKPALSALLARAAQLSGEASITAMAREVASYALKLVDKENVPLGKLLGLELHRTHSAVAVLARLEEGAGIQQRPPTLTRAGAGRAAERTGEVFVPAEAVAEE